MWWVPAHMNAQTIISGNRKKSGLIALMAAIRTLGATPTMPTPFEAAAIVPAVCVPCPSRSLAGGRVAGAPLEQSVRDYVTNYLDAGDRYR